MVWRNTFLDPAQPGGWALLYNQQHFLADSNGVLFPRDWVKRQDLQILGEQGIGHFGDDAVYLLQLKPSATLEGCSWQSLRQFMLQGEAETFRMLAYAAQIGTWYAEHRYCGSCGAPTRQLPGERAMRCDSCESQHYPRISPSMIVLVTRGDEILLARSPRFVTGVYSTLAGFVEPGESVEHCVAREVREEVSVEVKNLQYIGSQGWPFPHSLMLGFHAEYAGGEIVMQEDEIEDARWFRVDDLPPLPASRSIARHLIDLYVARRLGLPEPTLPA
ncbi:NAD(+) diphosphatase [Ectopseudomonas alcaliphila]|uniref:NAD(+) diphosphatase n=1 Tax=Ectopseudomonas alcaliphila TaxID=101564 RepID=UPI002784FF0F|nr:MULTISPECIES: NAD(+) diphosphatase [Pseudomonas]MDP9940758.1 NAD+ diphosphatase [Pseudomonas sp. 3400]MDR7011677.1 NAD+ diphosphatase [Pseudomonas alcaliphila]